MSTTILNILFVFNVIALFYVVIINAIYSWQLMVAWQSLTRYVKHLRYANIDHYVESENMIPISILVPAYNESATIVDNTKNLLKLDFPQYEVIVINDGSKDNSLNLLKHAFELVPFQQPYKKVIETNQVKAVYRSKIYPNLVVIDKVNGGKADALNVGINVSKYPVFVSIDADSLLEKQSLLRIIYSFMKDPTCVAMGGMIRIGDGEVTEDGRLQQVVLSKKPLIILQTVEYLRAFLAGRMGFDKHGLLLIISGAFGAFKKEAVFEVGGYSRNCIGEDMELIVKLHRKQRELKRKYTIKFVPDPICWTQPPETLKDLKKQRKRWHIGLMDTLWRHKKMLLNPRYGRIGMIALPYFWVFEMLGPLIELFGYFLVIISFALGAIDIWFLLAFFLVSMLYGVILSLGALLLEERSFRKYPNLSALLKLFFYAIIDNFGYRQVNAYYRMLGFFQYRKSKHSWGEIKRKSFRK